MTAPAVAVPPSVNAALQRALWHKTRGVALNVCLNELHDVIEAALTATRAATLAEVDAAAERIIWHGAVGTWRSGDWRALELSAEYQEDEPAAGLREGLTWFIGATDADTATGAILAEAASLDPAESAP